MCDGEVIEIHAQGTDEWSILLDRDLTLRGATGDTTLTGNGVSNLIRYWLGDHGYGPYLHNIQGERP